MGISTLLNGTLGFAILIALLFCMPSDIEGILNTETLYPFMSIYAHALGTKSGATALVRTHYLEFIVVVGLVKTGEDV